MNRDFIAASLGDVSASVFFGETAVRRPAPIDDRVFPHDLRWIGRGYAFILNASNPHPESKQTSTAVRVDAERTVVEVSFGC